MNEEILQNRELSTGGTFQFYQPEEINENTKIIYYEYGSSNASEHEQYKNGLKELNEYLEQNGCDAIVISCERYDNIDKIEILEIVSEETGVPITNLNTAAHSYGTQDALTTLAEVINEYPDMPPQSIVLLDGNWPWNSNIVQNDDVLSTLGSNKTTIFASLGQNKEITIDDFELWVTKYGINMVIIDEYAIGGCNPVDWGIMHDHVKESYTNDGLLKFQSGTGTFPYENSAKIFDGEEWIEIDIGGMTLDEAQAHISLQYENIYYSKEGINNINLLSSLGTINGTNGIVLLSNLSTSDLSVLSDSDLLAYYINQLSSSIRTTSFIQNSPNFTSSYSGNTSVPTEFPLYMNGYFSATTELLLKLSSDLNSISKIGYSIDIMEQSITKEVEKINTTTL